MKKSDLKAKWSKYCDTDELVDEMRDQLKTSGHPNSVHGICKLLDEYFTNNEENIKLFMTSKNYIGNMRIAIAKEFERKISAYEVEVFFRDIKEKLFLDHLLQYEDANGKTIEDYLLNGRNVYTLSDLPNAEEQTARMKNINKFDLGLKATKESADIYYTVNDYMYEFQYRPYATLQHDVKPIRDNAILLKKGTKTSRAFNEMCAHYGVDKLNPQTVIEDRNGERVTRTIYPYNKVFATYSDLVSNLARKMYFVISLNPLDYLNMSNGVSWKSCHNIVDGCYKGGTLSYMLDSTSMVTFVVSDLSGNIHETPRHYRQMFHYDNGMFMQNRLYPQGNDGATNLYDKFRGFVIEEFAALLKTNDEWDVETGANKCSPHVHKEGAHYEDYRHNNSCNIFYPHSKKNTIYDYVMTVGHAGICAKCGKEYTASGRLSHNIYDECVIETEV